MNDELDMPPFETMTYEQMSEDRDFWKQQYFELLRTSGEMIKILAGRYVKDLDQNHAADGLTGWDGPQ